MTALDIHTRRRDTAIEAHDPWDGRPRPELTSIVKLAARICDVPMATINLVTSTHQHQVATVGFDAGVCRRQDSMCAVILHEETPVVVPNALRDERFADNPFVTGELGHVRFYAAVPMVTRTGVPFGALCVFDETPRMLEAAQLDTLVALAGQVVDVFEFTLREREQAATVSELEQVKVELERSNERLGSFAGQVSHDLKTPLTSLTLSLELIGNQLEEGETDPDLLGLLDRALKGSARMSNLLDDVLDYAQLGGTLKESEVELGRLLGEVVTDLEHELQDVDLEVGRLPTVLGDETQLRAVLQNLVGNAAKYGHPERCLQISVSARYVLRAWRIEIADNGKGVPPDQQHRVFEPRARIDESVKGWGIGLATARRIIRAHGGSIGLDPSARDGSTFWFELPG